MPNPTAVNFTTQNIVIPRALFTAIRDALAIGEAACWAVSKTADDDAALQALTLNLLRLRCDKIR